ncbi:MAG TPA: TorF family putative porin [Gammaproteobacteria bacterium]
MKKMNQKLLAGVLAVSAVAAGVVSPSANAGVAASVGASNMYYWRGMDLGNGDAAVWGDLKLSSDVGAYGGVWASSGDAVNGTEYDLYVGYGTKFGDFGVDLSYWTYVYPSAATSETVTTIDFTTEEVVETEVELDPFNSPGDLAEYILALSYGPVVFTYYDNAEGADDYSYYTLAATHEAFTFKYGEHEDAEGAAANGFSHFDITYAYNSKVSFTLGTVGDGGDGELNEEAKFVVNVALPIE